VVSFTPCSLYPQGKSHQYPLDRRLGGLHDQSGHSDKENSVVVVVVVVHEEALKDIDVVQRTYSFQ
jgi:hypothetical protein